MPIDRFVAPAKQMKYIDPYQTRIFQYNTSHSDVFLSRVVNSIYRIIGNDVVIDGFDIADTQFVSIDDEVFVSIEPGLLIQDNTLVEISERIQVNLPSVSSLDPAGKIVAYIRYSFLNTIEKNDAYVCLNYISPQNLPLYSWDKTKDRTIIGIFEFTQDEDHNVTGIMNSIQHTIVISDTLYYLQGYSPTGLTLKKYFLNLLNKYKTGSSIALDDGLSFVNDVGSPGTSKYYGTNLSGVKGWHNLPAQLSELPTNISFTDLDDCPGFFPTGTAKNLVSVKSDRSGLEFIDLEKTLHNSVVTIHNDQVIRSNKIIDGNLVVLGDFSFRGDLTELDVTNHVLDDVEIVLNNNEKGNGVTLQYSGLRVKRGIQPDFICKFDESNDRLRVGFSQETLVDVVIKSDLDEIYSAISNMQSDGINMTDTITQTKYRLTIENGSLKLNEL